MAQTFLEWYEALDDALRARGHKGSEFLEEDLRREHAAGADPHSLASHLIGDDESPKAITYEAWRQSFEVALGKRGVATHAIGNNILQARWSEGVDPVVLAEKVAEAHKSASNQFNYGCLGVVILIVLGGAWILNQISSSSAQNGITKVTEQIDDGTRDAYYMAQQFVKRKLKAPATAEFPSFYDLPKGNITKGSDGTYTVRGHVDSENSFGAKLRSEWVSQVKPGGGDEWLDLGTVIVE